MITDRAKPDCDIAVQLRKAVVAEVFDVQNVPAVIGLNVQMRNGHTAITHFTGPGTRSQWV